MEPPAPQAQGVFTKTPFSNLLVYAMDKGLNGTMELAAPEGHTVTVLFANGIPAKARLTESVLFLGDILVELGHVTDEQHQVVLAQHQVSGDLYGQALLAQGLISEEQLMEGLATQLTRKIEYVFTLSPDTTFAYYDAFNGLEGYGTEEYPAIDPFAAMWAGIRANPPWEHVHEALTRIGNAAVKLGANASPERFGFGKAELAAIEMVRGKPHRMYELSQSKILGPTAAQLFVYCLLITRQVDLVEVPPSLRPGALAAGSAPPPSVRPAPAAAPQRPPGTLPQPQAQATKAPPQAQLGPPAIAKVQLKQTATGGGGGAIAEQTSMSPRDNRIASPMPQAIPLPQREPNHPLPPPSQRGFPSTGRVHAPTPGIAMSPMGTPGMSGGSGSGGSVPNIPVSPSSTGSLPAAQRTGPVPAVNVPPEKRAEYELMKKKILDKADKISAMNYFEMLGVKENAKPEDVQKAFFALAKEWHPDRLPTWLADVKDQCSKVFAHLSEANQTLSDTKRRTEYMTLLKDGGATPDDQAKIQAVLEATTSFSKAEFYLKKNDLVQAEAFCRKAYEGDPGQADYIAMLAWLESQKPQYQDKDQTRARIAMLDKAIKMNENCERAYFYRGMLHKRMDAIVQAMKDFKMAAELNPRNLDAMRELRLYQMRKGQPGGAGGGSIAPPAPTGGPSRTSSAPKPGGKGGDTVGGLFGKLFKK